MSYLQQFDWRVEIRRQSRARRCYLRICILLREDISSLEQPGDGHSQQGSIFVVANYLNQQKHFVRGLFDPPYLEANIIMFSKFVENLGQLVVTLRKDTCSQPVYPRLASSARRTWTTS